MIHRLLAVAIVSLLAAGAQAQTLQYVSNVRVMVDDQYDEIYAIDNPDMQTVQISTATGNSIAQAQIAPGVNHAYAHWDSLDGLNPAETLMADAMTHWTDTVTISDPDLNGTVGHFTASLRVFGSASFNLTGAYASGNPYDLAAIYGFWDSWIGTSTDGGGSFLVGGWFGDWYSDWDGTIYYSGDELNQPLTEVELEFIYGQPFLLRMNLEAYFDAENPYLLEGTVEGTLDFSHTAYWNGMGNFTDAVGSPVNPGYSSASGIDWRNPVVPEPAGLAVLGLGVLGILKLRQRRR